MSIQETIAKLTQEFMETRDPAVWRRIAQLTAAEDDQRLRAAEEWFTVQSDHTPHAIMDVFYLIEGSGTVQPNELKSQTARHLYMLNMMALAGFYYLRGKYRERMQERAEQQNEQQPGQEGA